MGGPGSGRHGGGGMDSSSSGSKNTSSNFKRVAEDIKSQKGKSVNYSSPAFQKAQRRQKRGGII